MTKVLALISAFGCIAAGLYLLDAQAAAEDSLIETLMHGIGIYFLAKGLYLGASLYLQDDMRTMMRRSAEARGKRDREAATPSP